MHFLIAISFLIPLAPLVGAIISGFFGDKYLKQQSHLPIWIGVGTSAVLSVLMLFGMMGAAHNATQNGGSIGYVHECYTWIDVGGFKANAGFFFDPLTVVMMTAVTVIGFFITVFSAGYMKGEAGYARFFAYLGLFIFSMTCLVMGSNLLMLYLGWEGVGLCSYLLIGYYYERPGRTRGSEESVHRQSRRRLWLRARHHEHLSGVRDNQLLRQRRRLAHGVCRTRNVAC